MDMEKRNTSTNSSNPIVNQPDEYEHSSKQSLMSSTSPPSPSASNSDMHAGKEEEEKMSSSPNDDDEPDYDYNNYDDDEEDDDDDDDDEQEKADADYKLAAKALGQSPEQAIQRTMSRRRSSALGSTGHTNGAIAFSEDGSLSSDGMPLDDAENDRDEVKEVAKLARWETVNLRCWRTGVFLLLLITGATVSTVAYLFFQQAEEDDFKVDYYNFANTIREISQQRITNTIMAFNELSVAVTAFALQSNSTFPYVTLPMFEVSGQQARLKSGVQLFAYCPIVSQFQKATWENYTMTHQEWIAASREIYLSSGFALPGTTYLTNETVSPQIWEHGRYFGPGAAPRPVPSFQPPYAPTWQVSPPPYSPRLINYNLFSEDYIQDMFHTVLVARESVISTIRSSSSGDSNVGNVVSPSSSSTTNGNNGDDGITTAATTPTATATATTTTTTTSSSSSSSTGTGTTTPTNILLDDQQLAANASAGMNGLNINNDHPHSILAQPVFNRLKDETSSVSAVLLAVIPWDQYVVGLLPAHVRGMYVVLANSCDQEHTYKLNGGSAVYLGEGVIGIEDEWKYMGVTFSLSDHMNNSTRYEEGHCTYTFTIYPSSELRAGSGTPLQVIFAIATAMVFLITAILFSVYDCKVRKQNKIVINIAARSNKLVSSLFPATVRDRLLFATHDEDDDGDMMMGGMGGDLDLMGADGNGGVDGVGGAGIGGDMQGTQTRIKDFLANDGTSALDMEQSNDFMYKTKPIADLFPETTIMFGDIAGFTAWSSAREPSQVFVLLETVYRAFDLIAKRRRIFKVETVGDCYVAVAGLPEPRKDHAVAMARFARGCMRRMQSLTRKLEVQLGPDTADLTMRMGMHSGPVTAGVLRGDNARFQLFGDTMNTASRMESTGQRDCIQLSTETANLLIAAGKSDWIVPREDKVVAKGKGELSTYWLILEGRDGQSVNSGGDGSGGDDNSAAEKNAMLALNGTGSSSDIACSSFSPKIQRMIDWNVDLLTRLLHGIVARRQAQEQRLASSGSSRDNLVFDETDEEQLSADEKFNREDGITVLDEVQDFIALPEFDKKMARTEVDPDSIELDSCVEYQLHDYVSAIAAMYRENNFHNFEHASHVTMSVAKLLSRIVAPSDFDFENKASKQKSLHDHTYGITSDPLTQFACILSALIHDVDHTGVPNTRLVIEKPDQGAYYRGRSVAEQNSVDLAWNLLMQDNFTELRRTIYSTSDELHRFRHLVVNCVMATDIMDKELKALRNGRWEKAFSLEGSTTEDPRATTNRKATIVIEHLLQASDVSHTMQHWHIFRKWNERLFREMYSAYREGRADKNPADFWYEGEIGFFDFYVIPLAKKLKECGVFGVSSEEYLNYAMKNRKEWEARGREVVGELIEAAQRNHEDNMQAAAGDEGMD